MIRIDNCLSVSRTVKAATEPIWSVRERSDLFERWFTPLPVKTASNRYEFYPGGAFDYTTTLSDGTEMRSEGRFLLTEECCRIAFTAAESFFTSIFEIEDSSGGPEIKATALHKTKLTERSTPTCDLNLNRDGTAHSDSLMTSLPNCRQR